MTVTVTVPVTGIAQESKLLIYRSLTFLPIVQWGDDLYLREPRRAHNLLEYQVMI